MLEIPALIPMGAGNRSYLEIPRILLQQSIPVFILERFLEIWKAFVYVYVRIQRVRIFYSDCTFHWSNLTREEMKDK